MGNSMRRPPGWQGPQAGPEQMRAQGAGEEQFPAAAAWTLGDVASGRARGHRRPSFSAASLTGRPSLSKGLTRLPRCPSVTHSLQV